MDKIIFLDIDGVLNHHRYYCSLDWEQRRANYDEFGEYFCPVSSKILNKIIEKSNAKIVMSSSWRHDGLEKMQQMWKVRNMSGEVIDITPNSERRFRGLEIQDWLDSKGFYHVNWDKNEQLKVMEKSNISNYIIIDDDSDMTYNQRNHFIQILQPPRNYSGFNFHYGIKALNMLNSDIIALNFKDV